MGDFGGCRVPCLPSLQWVPHRGLNRDVDRENAERLAKLPGSLGVGGKFWGVEAGL